MMITVCDIKVEQDEGSEKYICFRQISLREVFVIHYYGSLCNLRIQFERFSQID